MTGARNWSRPAVLLLAAGLALGAPVGLAAATQPDIRAAVGERGSAGAGAEPDLPDLTVTSLASGLNNPWDVEFTPDGTLLFDQLRGGIGAVLPGGEVRNLAGAASFPDNFTGNESGVMGMAVDPGFTRNGTIYLCQTLGGPNPAHPGVGARNAVIKWQIDAAFTIATRKEIIVDGLQPVPLAGDPQGGQGRHVGCRLRLDAAGLLYISVGDGRTPTGPEDINSPLGKVLRVTLAGAPAPGNPFADNRNAIAKEVYTYGHRNPQGLAIAPGTGQVWETEHGPDIDDEINLLTAGADYGWNPVAQDGSYQDNGTPMTRPGATPAAWSSGDPTIATSGATFLVGSQWGAWAGALAVATLKGVSLHLFSVDPGSPNARAAPRAATLRESASTVIDAADVAPADAIAAGATQAGAAPAGAAQAAPGSADPIGSVLNGMLGRLRTAQLGPDGALYLTTSNGNSQDYILRVAPSRHCSAGADNPTPTAVAGVRADNGTTAFVRGADDAVWFRRTDVAVGYDTLGGTVQYGPAAVSPNGDELDVFSVGTDGGLYLHSTSGGGPWSGWLGLGGLLSAAPAAVSVSDDRIDVFGRGLDGALWTISRAGGTWTGWSSLGGILTAAPGAAADPATAVATVGVRGTDGRLYQFQFGAAGPDLAGVGFVGIGTPICSAPAYAGRAAGDSVDIAYRTGDFTLSINGTAVGGQLRSAPALLAQDEPGQVSALAQGVDDALWSYRGAAGSGSWTSLGGRLH